MRQSVQAKQMNPQASVSSLDPHDAIQEKTKSDGDIYSGVARRVLEQRVRNEARRMVKI